MLDAHNHYRSLHGSPPLRRDFLAERSAQAWADHMLETKRLYHGGYKGFGQNVGFRFAANPQELGPMNGFKATSMWYDEIKHYNFDDPEKSGYTGHFENLIWASTRELGVGVANDGHYTYWVAHYYPPGRQDYAANIKRPLITPR